MSDKLKMKRGNSSNLPGIDNGSIVFAKDTGAMYVDCDNQRIRVKPNISYGDSLPDTANEGDIFLLLS